MALHADASHSRPKVSLLDTRRPGIRNSGRVRPVLPRYLPQRLEDLQPLGHELSIGAGEAGGHLLDRARAIRLEYLLDALRLQHALLRPRPLFFDAVGCNGSLSFDFERRLRPGIGILVFRTQIADDPALLLRRAPLVEGNDALENLLVGQIHRRSEEDT